MKISQSLMKDWNEFIEGELCGAIFEAKYITKTWDRNWNDSPSKKLGRYFEYILTGAKPTGYEDYPEPEYMLSALKKKEKNPNYKFTIEDMYEPYRLAHRNAERIKALLSHSSVRIERSQVYLTKGILEGNIDVEAIYKGRKINIDIKYSGLIFDKWNKFGWVWTEDQKKCHGKQGIQYHLLNGRPMFFLVVSSTNDKDVKFFEMVIDDFTKEQHLLKAESIQQSIEIVKEVGFQNYPDLKKCSECPLADKCKDRVTELVPERVEIDIYN